MKQLNIFDKDLQKTAAQNCTISILLAGDGYCFSIKDVSQDRYMLLKTFPGDYKPDDVKAEAEALMQLIWENPKLIKTEHLIYSNRHCLLIPPAFDEDTQLNDIVNFHFPVNFDKLTLKSRFDKYSMAYLVNAENHKKYVDIFRPEHVGNMAESLIKTALEYAEGQENNAVHVQVWKSHFDLVVVKNKQILMFNSYRYKSGNDIVYFILNAYKQLVLDPKQTALMLSGWIEKNDNAVIQLNKFIRNMYFETVNPQKKYSYHFQDSLPHYFIHFLNIH
ncbi:MAG: DUF3822 family protein [Bacteroidales bacterium]|jgi:hypothetical protein|nr:DUF3822 family protein [Bacteroidales bacterium]